MANVGITTPCDYCVTLYKDAAVAVLSKGLCVGTLKRTLSNPTSIWSMYIIPGNTYAGIWPAPGHTLLSWAFGSAAPSLATAQAACDAYLLSTVLSPRVSKWSFDRTSTTQVNFYILDPDWRNT